MESGNSQVALSFFLQSLPCRIFFRRNVLHVFYFSLGKKFRRLIIHAFFFVCFRGYSLAVYEFFFVFRNSNNYNIFSCSSVSLTTSAFGQDFL